MPSFVSRILALCRNLFRRRKVEQELSDELAQAFEFLVESKIRDGTSRSEARRLAAIELGGVEQLKEEIREFRAGHSLEALFRDARFGLRMLLKTPGFTVVALATLALGIGANTAIFSLVNGVLLRPLPFPDAERIIYIEGKNPAAGITESNISFLDFTDWSQQTDLFANTAAYWTGNAQFGADGAEPERVPRAGVTAGFFSVLGVHPVLGRTFVSEDDKGWPQRVAIISHGLWKRRFGSDPAIVGKQVQMSARPLTIIGVMPQGFEYPEQTQVWVPTAVNLRDEPRDNRVWSAIARLNTGIDLKQAQTRLSAINAQLAKQFHETNKGWDVSISPLHERLVREVKPSLLALLGAVGFVLLIACANVANLLLARSAARQKEMAIRAAMGASRSRVLRQMLTESILLSAIGGVAGLFLSIWLTDVLMSMLPEGAPRIEQVGIDYRVLAFALGISALTGILFGIVPALQASKLDVTSALKEGGRSGEGHRRTSARSLLLIGEVALSLMLLVGAGLLIKSFLRLQEVRPGFNAHNVLIANLALQGPKYKDDQPCVEFFRQLIERLEVVPGVQAAGGSVNLPLNASGYAIGRGFIPEGRPLTVDEAKDAMFSTITGDYFRALQIPLLSGRTFEPRDNANGPKVVIINETTAKRHFGSPTAAIGKRLSIWAGFRGHDEKAMHEIVGVVGDTKTGSLTGEGGMQIYVPHAQDSQWNFMGLVIRTASDPAAFPATLRREVQALDKDQPVYNVRTMDDVVANSLGTRRVSMQLFAVFACAALLLAAIGIYGVMAYSVTQRTQEIGIRMALGAQKSDILRLVVRQGMTVTLIGVIAGLAGAFALTRVIANLLFGVGASDPVTFVVIPLLLIFVSLIACYLPARRAARLNPTAALAKN
ncbi:MAG TPA: ABC transporter permease [Chthoniobacterales bacterium]|nr:ABC transporter permease [Chthoniobacterales bacterium]